MLPEEEKEKAVGQLKLQFGVLFQPFMKYGFQQDHELPAAIEEAIELAILFGQRYSGIDQQITLELAKKKAARRRKR